jgi:hypothetical protein
VILQVSAWIATLGIVVIFSQAVRLWFVSRGAADPRAAPGAADEYLFAFLVPALNEARVIENTLDRLLALPVRHSLALVIDDASDDATGSLVESRSDPRLGLLRRELPLARRGKGAALNAGFRQLLHEVAGWPADKVVVGIMDADGWLDPEAPERVAAYFADAGVGAVQVAVRIDNRQDSALARLQDMEFVTYTDVFQSARDVWGVAGLGGNGQFVRLAAHLDLAPEPWTDGLTEDLEQGLRLICAGWRTRYCREVAVPGVSSKAPMNPEPSTCTAMSSGTMISMPAITASARISVSRSVRIASRRSSCTPPQNAKTLNRAGTTQRPRRSKPDITTIDRRRRPGMPPTSSRAAGALAGASDVARSRVSGRSSACVVEVYAACSRSSSSSMVIRPSAAASRSRSATRSRSASEARSSTGPSGSCGSVMPRSFRSCRGV